MSLTFIFAGSCIVFVAICLAAYANDKRDKRHHSATATPVYRVFREPVRTQMKNKLQAKNFNPVIADLLADASMASPVYLSAIQRRLKCRYNEAWRIMDQMENIGFVSMFDGKTRRWNFGSDNPEYLMLMIDKK